MGKRTSVWFLREPLVASAVLALVLLFVLDFFTPDYFVPNFFVVPLIASAYLGRLRVTLGLSVLALILGGIATVHDEGFTTVGLARITLLAIVGATSCWVALSVGSARARWKESEAQMRLLVENASDIVFRSTPEAVIEWVSPSVRAELGYEPNVMIGRPVGSFVHPDDVARVMETSRELHTNRRVTYRARFQCADGRLTWLEVNVRPLLQEGEVVGRIGSARRIDHQVALEEELRRKATTDDLTGATRRNEALRHLENLRRDHSRTGHESAVIFCDIDNFKAINDTFGHGGGDEVLRQMAERLRSGVREEDSVARFGGDEFVVVLHSIHSLEDAQRIAAKLHLATYVPMHLSDGREVHATLSMGLTPVRPGESIAETLERADQALYEAKEAGRDRVVCHA